MASEKEIKYYLRKLEVSEVKWDKNWEEIEKRNIDESIDFSKYTKEQRTAIHSIEGNYLVVAGPGTGKTNTLIFRIKIMKEIYKINLEKILVLSFSKKSVIDFKIRCLANGLEEEKLPIFTFHSFCYKILKEYNEYFKLLSQKEKKVIEGYIERDLLEKSLDEIEKNTVKKVIISEYKNTKNYLEFDDIIEKVNLIFERDKKFFNKILDRYSYIMIDEYQDLNEKQLEIITKFGNSGVNTMNVGDDCQTIYEFRGADCRNVLSFKKYFPNGKLIKFQNNFRTTSEISKFINEILKNIEYKIEKKNQGIERGLNGEKPKIVQLKNLQDEGEYIAVSIRKILEEKEAKIGILCKNKYYFNHIEKALKKYNIEYFFNKNKENDSNIISVEEEFLDLYNFFRNPTELSLEKIRESIRENSYEKQLKNRDIIKIIISNENVENDSNLLYKVEIDGTKYEMIKNVYKQLKNEIVDREEKIEIFLKLYRDLKIENIELEEKINKIKSYFENEKELNIKPALEYGLSEKKKIKKNKRVELLTIHSSKGLEWDYIFIPSVVEGVYPLKKNNDLDSERRVFYVGCSRGKLGITLTCPEYILEESSKKVPISPFIRELNSSTYEFIDKSFIE